MNYILFKYLKYNISYLRHYSSEVRVRFAPSPTGFLHLGGLRTALYNYLFARSNNGKFILRIEDTDRKRLVNGAAEALEEDLNWLGISPDESPIKGGNYGPYIQSERTDYYLKETNKLIENGSAYYCFCSERRLEMLRKDAIKNRQVPKYDNHCRHLTINEVNKKLSTNRDKCVRFKLTFSDGFKDLIYGDTHYNVEDVEGDPIILKQDGLPTYHLANVVDDYYMKISHVVRGVEWLQSTDKHLMIYKALGYQPPIFAHLPLLLNTDGSKLSKRQGDITINSLRIKGVEPKALLNFLSSVGGGYSLKTNENLNLSLNDLTKHFNINLINSNSCKLPLERLKEFNRTELIHLINSDQNHKIINQFKNQLINHFKNNNNYDNTNLQIDNHYIENVLKYFSSRIYYLSDLLDKNLLFLWIRPKLYNFDSNSLVVLNKLKIILNDTDFSKSVLSVVLKDFSSKNNISFKELMHLLRSVLCGLKEGPSVAEMMELLGKEVSLNRINSALNEKVNGEELNKKVDKVG